MDEAERLLKEYKDARHDWLFSNSSNMAENERLYKIKEAAVLAAMRKAGGVPQKMLAAAPQPPALDDWRSMDTAPKDGAAFQCEIPGEGSDFVVQWIHGLEGKDGPCGGWSIASEQEPPACWTDGICWETNEDGLPSKQPMRWKPPAPALDRNAVIEACAKVAEFSTAREFSGKSVSQEIAAAIRAMKGEAR